MTYSQTQFHPLAALTNRFSAWKARNAEFRAQYRAYRDVRSELSALTDRDLADIGIARSQIDEIARTHAFGA